jgi:hypothetical protein
MKALKEDIISSFTGRNKWQRKIDEIKSHYAESLSKAKSLEELRSSLEDSFKVLEKVKDEFAAELIKSLKVKLPTLDIKSVEEAAKKPLRGAYFPEKSLKAMKIECYKQFYDVTRDLQWHLKDMIHAIK